MSLINAQMSVESHQSIIGNFQDKFSTGMAVL